MEKTSRPESYCSAILIEKNNTANKPLKSLNKKTCQSRKNALARSHFFCGSFSFFVRPHNSSPINLESLYPAPV